MKAVAPRQVGQGVQETGLRYDVKMAKRKTTVYVDEDVLRAAKVYAARKDIRDSDVIETALRKYLGMDVLQPVWDRNLDLDPEQADRLAYAEIDAARGERRRRKKP